MENSMRMGYSFWGYMADVKLAPDGTVASTPDGNAAYSWALVNGFKNAGYETVRFGIDRDSLYVDQCGMAAFSSFATDRRWNAYNALVTPSSYSAMSERDYALLTEDDFVSSWERCGFQDVEFIIHEWRMTVPGRNDEETRQLCLAGDGGAGYMPDLVIQNAVIAFCRKHGIPLVLFDLDYKLTEEQYTEIVDIAYVIELGNKWPSQLGYGLSRKVFIPFDREEMLRKELMRTSPERCLGGVVYIGNQYERNDLTDEMFADSDVGLVLCGKWDQKWLWLHGIMLESNVVTGRIQTFQIGPMYRLAPCTVLLAKDEYYRWNFMTARIVEAAYWGCVPMFPVATAGRCGFRDDVVNRYLMNDSDTVQKILVEDCTVRSGEELEAKVGRICEMMRNYELEYDLIRDTLRRNVALIHDEDRFVHEVLDLVNNGRLNDALSNV